VRENRYEGKKGPQAVMRRFAARMRVSAEKAYSREKEPRQRWNLCEIQRPEESAKRYFSLLCCRMVAIAHRTRRRRKLPEQKVSGS